MRHAQREWDSLVCWGVRTSTKRWNYKSFRSEKGRKRGKTVPSDWLSAKQRVSTPQWAKKNNCALRVVTESKPLQAIRTAVKQAINHCISWSSAPCNQEKQLFLSAQETVSDYLFWAWFQVPQLSCLFLMLMNHIYNIICLDSYFIFYFFKTPFADAFFFPVFEN